jgi:hypothetical protein
VVHEKFLRILDKNKEVYGYGNAGCIFEKYGFSIIFINLNVNKGR